MGNWIAQIVEQLGYAGIALLMFAETVFPPLPSEVIMPLAGMQTSSGAMSLTGVIIAGSFGAMAGNILWFAAARALGIQRLKSLIDRHGRWLTIGWEDVERGQRGMAGNGRWFVCFGRLVPTIRSIVSIPAGLLKMGWRPFLFWSSLGTMGWTALLTSAGAFLGERFSTVETVVGPVATAIVVILAIVYVWRVIRWKQPPK